MGLRLRVAAPLTPADVAVALHQPGTAEGPAQHLVQGDVRRVLLQSFQGMDVSTFSQRQLSAVALRLKRRPQKALEFVTSGQATAGVALTD